MQVITRDNSEPFLTNNNPNNPNNPNNNHDLQDTLLSRILFLPAEVNELRQTPANPSLWRNNPINPNNPDNRDNCDDALSGNDQEDEEMYYGEGNPDGPDGPDSPDSPDNLSSYHDEATRTLLDEIMQVTSNNL